jgi:non-homologous end joining protein Ku
VTFLGTSLNQTKFKDTYREKILKIAAQKAAGQEVTAPEAPKRGKVIDLMSALKDSLKSQKKGVPKDSEDEVAHYDRAKSREKAVRRAPQSSRHPQSRRRARS